MDHAQVQSGGSPYEIVTPYSDTQVGSLKYAQNADIMWVTHGSYPLKKLSRTGHTSWTLTSADLKWGPFLDTNTTSTTLQPSATTGSITLTASSATFQSGHVGSVWSLLGGYVEVTAYTDSTHVTATVKETLSGTGTTTDWAEGAFSDVQGYPTCVVLFEQRLYLGGTSENPQTVWASKVGDYDDFHAGTSDDDSFSYTIGSDEVNAIRWMSSGKVVVPGTFGGGFSLAGSSDGPITPSNVTVKRETTYGSSDIQPVKIGNFVYYVQRNGTTVREFAYNWEIDEYDATDMTLLADHIAGDSGIKEMAYQQSPYNILWCVRKDGQIATLTRQIKQQVVGWGRRKTDGKFESICVLPGDGEDDQVWVIVNRTIGGATKRYVEYFKPFTQGEIEDEFHVDCGLSQDSEVAITGATQANPVVITATAHGFSNGDTVIIRNVGGMTELNYHKFLVANKTTNTFEITDADGVDIDGTSYTAYTSSGEVRKCTQTLSGLSHLEGKTLSILGDGAVFPQETVSSGSITIDYKAGEIHAGLPYTCKLVTLRSNAGSQQGTAQGKIKRIHKAMVRLYRTVGCSVGNEDRTDVIAFRTPSDDMDVRIDYFSGDKEVVFPGDYDSDGYVVVEQSNPLPVCVLSATLFMRTYEG